MKLEFPNESHKENYENMIASWWKIENLSEISPWALFLWKNFEEFLEITNEHKINSKSWVNSDLYFLIDDVKNIVWAIQLRHTLWNTVLKEFWGHIWYWISPEFRKKWYAGKALELLLIKAKEFWLEKILITCEINNIASRKVIEKNWWIFERLSKCGKYNRFWINL